MPRSSQSRPQCAQIADHLAQNTPNSLNFTEVVCTLGASIPNTANMETAARPTGLPQRPWATEPGRTSETTHRSASFTTTPQVWRAPEGPEGLAGLRGAAPNEVRSPSLAGGRTLRRPEHQRGLAAVPVGGGRAWPGNEPTRRAKLAARTASGRADPHQSPRPHRSGGRRRVRRARAGFEARRRTQ